MTTRAKLSPPSPYHLKTKKKKKNSYLSQCGNDGYWLPNILREGESFVILTSKQKEENL